MFTLTNEEIHAFYKLCHGPKSEESVHDWEMRMLDMLGPDDCMFIIRSRKGHCKGDYLMTGHNDAIFFIPRASQAKRFTWGETAVRITNNRYFEALRVINPAEAITSKGGTVSLIV